MLEFDKFMSGVLKMLGNALDFVAQHPRAFTLLAAATLLLLLAHHVHEILWLPIGLGLMVWGAKLRDEDR